MTVQLVWANQHFPSFGEAKNSDWPRKESSPRHHYSLEKRGNMMNSVQGDTNLVFIGRARTEVRWGRHHFMHLLSRENEHILEFTLRHFTLALIWGDEDYVQVFNFLMKLPVFLLFIISSFIDFEISALWKLLPLSFISLPPKLSSPPLGNESQICTSQQNFRLNLTF